MELKLERCPSDPEIPVRATTPGTFYEVTAPAYYMGVIVLRLTDALQTYDLAVVGHAPGSSYLKVGNGWFGHTSDGLLVDLQLRALPAGSVFTLK